MEVNLETLVPEATSNRKSEEFLGSHTEISQTHQEILEDTQPPFANWQYLPNVPLANIYSYLPESDRFGMSLVCRSWNVQFYNPVLWRRQRYKFFGSRYENSRRTAFKALGFSSLLGRHLRVLEMECVSPSPLICTLFQGTFHEFAGHLTHHECQLRILKMSRLRLERNGWPMVPDRRQQLCIAIINFLVGQYCLTYVDMAHAYFDVPTGLNVMEALATANTKRNALRMLNMENFFESGADIRNEVRFLVIFSKLSSLSKVYLNYSYVTSEVIDTLCANRPNSLTYLSITAHDNEDLDHEVAGSSWTRLGKVHPGVHVHISLEDISDTPSVRRILLPEVPLKDLLWRSGPYRQDFNWDLKAVLKYISEQFGSSLDSVFLDLEGGEEVDLGASLVSFLTKCVRLKDADIQIKVPLDTVESLCLGALNNDIRLPRLMLTLDYLSSVEMMYLDALIAIFQPLLMERNLDYTFEGNASFPEDHEFQEIDEGVVI